MMSPSQSNLPAGTAAFDDSGVLQRDELSSTPTAPGSAHDSVPPGDTDSAPTTNYYAPPSGTEKTGETDLVANDEFLKVIFGNDFETARPVVVSFKGNPSGIAPGAWGGRPWSPESKPLPSDANNYFSVAAFKEGADGEVRRRKTHFSALRCIVLDDVGTKVEPVGLRRTTS
ncbi:MAG: hypothetical protein U1F10_15510 [Burkholderiales bacterium]